MFYRCMIYICKKIILKEMKKFITLFSLMFLGMTSLSANQEVVKDTLNVIESVVDKPASIEKRER